MPIAPSPAVLRAGDLLAHLAHHPTESFSVSELARRVSVPRATCDAILQALAAHRLVTRRDEDLRYGLGPGHIALGEAARAGNSALRAAKVEAERLARAIHACVAVCVRDGDTARVAEVFDFAPVFALRARVGQAIRLVPPFGAVFVAWTDEDVEGWIARADATLEARERERYLRALEEVRRRGYSVSTQPTRRHRRDFAKVLAGSPDSETARRSRDSLIREMMHSEYLAAELDPDATVRMGQISAPVFDWNGQVTTSLLVSGPTDELTGAELRALGSRLLAAATRATRSAGGRERALPADASRRARPARARRA
jgi:DNA-binding IclR family transcriptional regulator